MNKDYKELLTKACNLLAVATDSFPSDDEIVIAIDELMEEIKEVESNYDDKDNWINVKDKLPDGDGNLWDGLEESKYVLVYGCCENRYGYGIGTYIRDHIDRDDGWDGCLSGLYDLYSCDVTHWMPLPEPPKEDEDEIS